jgi:CTP:molybdopterin cytidylyltransferase MocA
MWLDFAAAHLQSICQPSRQGWAWHPVVLPAKAFRELADSPDEDLRQFLQRRIQDSALCEREDPGLDFDLDTPADYERALRLFIDRT